MRYALTVAAILFSYPALATSNDRPTNITNNNQPIAIGEGGQGGRGGSASARVRVNTTTIAAQAQRQRQAQAQRQTAQGGNADVRVQGGDQNVTVDGTGGGYDYRRTAPAYAAAAAIAPNCGAGFSVGGNTIQGTGALGFSWETESCRKDRLAARAASLGYPGAGIALLCSMDEVKEAMAAAGTPCPTANQPVMASVSAPATTQRQMHTSRPVYCGNLAARGLVTAECE